MAHHPLVHDDDADVLKSGREQDEAVVGADAAGRFHFDVFTPLGKRPASAERRGGVKQTVMLGQILRGPGKAMSFEISRRAADDSLAWAQAPRNDLGVR